MKNNKMLRRTYKKFKYFIPISGLIFFTIQIIFLLIDNPDFSNIVFDAILVLSVISALTCIFLIFHPQKYLIYGIFFLIFTVLFTFSDYSEITILLCYIAALVIFSEQGFFNHKSILKLVLSLLVLGAITAVRIILFKKEYFVRLIQVWPYLFTLVVIIFFTLKIFVSHQNETEHLVINLDEYEELTDRQKKLIESILKNEKFDTFSRENNVSISTVKKDAVVIYKVFDVFDSKTFLLKYANHDFLWKKRKLERKEL